MFAAREIVAKHLNVPCQERGPRNQESWIFQVLVVKSIFAQNVIVCTRNLPRRIGHWSLWVPIRHTDERLLCYI